MTGLAMRLLSFFLPPPGTPLWQRLLPYVLLGALTLILLVAGTYAWDYTNSPDFCGTTCHTMPPEYNAYLVSPHARVQCVECHIGRGFFATRFTRKAGDVKHIVSLAFQSYEFPIRAKELRPARETCERCHFPEKFSDDSLREIRRFSQDVDNTAQSVYLTMKTGGGSQRQGLGRGIHWHIENQVLFLSPDPAGQVIPYVQVIGQDGATSEYVDIEAGIDPQTIQADSLQRMDCITCHNRITHLIFPPEQSLDLLLARGIVSPEIPEIKRVAVEALQKHYADTDEALQAIAGLANFYQVAYPDFYADQRGLIDDAVAALQETYLDSVFPEQKANWDTHPNNVGHVESPGCFRCHDGKHLNAQGEAIRLECNLCHSIPVVAGPEDFVARIEISRGPEPESHLNPSWISMHRQVFDDTCSSCHATDDPGGVSNTSFCSNSACHGASWEFAGFDAPALREILQSQLPPTVTPAPGPTTSGPPTYRSIIGPLLADRCGSCHGEDGMQGLTLINFEGLLAGGASGPAVVPGDAEASLLVAKQTGDVAHFGQLSSSEISLLVDWIEAGAPEE